MNVKRTVAAILAAATLTGSLGLGTLAKEADTAPQQPREDTQAVFYVSPTGSAAGDGSKTDPFGTLEQARDAVRKINDNMTGDIRVILRGGTYTLDETLEFTSEDSATNGYTISYEAAPGETPVLSGGREITGWQMHDAEANIWKATVPEGMNFRELYINDEKAIRSRSTDVDGEEAYDRIVSTNPYNWNDPQPEGGPYIVLNWSEVEGLDLTHGELFINNSWTGNVVRIDKVVRDSDNPDLVNVYLKEPESELIFNRPHPWVGNYRGSGHVQHAYRLENSYDLIDLEREWYLDVETQTLYVKAPKNLDLSQASVVAPQVETLVDVNGGSLDTLVRGLTFKGLTFEYSNWLVPSEKGFVDVQAMQYAWKGNLDNEIYVVRPDAAFHIACAADIRVEQNVFRNLAAVGIDLEYGTHDNVIKGNTLEMIGGNGIQVGKFTQDENTEMHKAYVPADAREICTNEKILNNTIRYTGQQYVGSVAIAAGYPKNITIANNTISHVPYTGISVGFGWTYDANAMAGNRIIRNDISYFAQITDDGGAIYTLSNQEPDSLLSENYIHDYAKSPWPEWAAHGLYLDHATSGFTVANNVISTSAQVWQPLHTNVPGPNNIQNNYFNVDVTGNAAAKAVAEAAGVQEYLQDTDTLCPSLIRAEISGNMVRLQGVFELDQNPAVIFTGAEGELSVTELMEYSGGQITCVIPQGAVAGDVYVQYENGMKSNPVALATGYVEGVVLEDDFQSGMLANEIWKDQGTSEVKPEVVQENSDGENLLLKLEGNGVETVNSYLATKLRFDFYFQEEQNFDEGLYLWINGTSGEQLCINPGGVYGNTIRYFGKSNVTVNKEITSQTWYTCLLQYEDQQAKVKIWEKGSDEPEAWDLTANVAWDSLAAGVLKIGHYYNTAKTAYVDNVQMWGGKEPVLDIPEIQIIAESSAVTLVGTPAVLPETVSVTYDNGDTADVAVQWEEVPAEKYQTEGSFQVTGRVFGTDMEAVCTVEVIASTLREDFEAYEPGRFPEEDARWEWTTPEHPVEIVEKDDNRCLRQTSNGQNAVLRAKTSASCQAKCNTLLMNSIGDR